MRTDQAVILAFCYFLITKSNYETPYNAHTHDVHLTNVVWSAPRNRRRKRPQVTMAIPPVKVIAISGNLENLFLNFGGGGLNLKMKSSALSVNFLPSLRYNFNTEKVSPTLGFGPQWYFKNRLIIGMPLYYLEGSLESNVRHWL
ncbi:MAG: hypothetical protein U5K54_05055 [Cytophagales bacterium]|nr:hypothetical protein [Cytophagales bacterium]